jgi:hypothetical protein
MSGKKYFYALGVSARARGLTKLQAEAYHRMDCAIDYARIAFDAGYRGLSL